MWTIKRKGYTLEITQAEMADPRKYNDKDEWNYKDKSGFENSVKIQLNKEKYWRQN